MTTLTDEQVAEGLREAEQYDRPCREAGADLDKWPRNSFERMAQLALALQERLKCKNLKSAAKHQPPPPSDYSRGIREGLERALVIVAAIWHRNGTVEEATLAIRAEASKLDGEKRPWGLSGNVMILPEPPAEEREPCSCHLGSVCTEACGYRICHDGCPRWGG